MYDYLIIAEKRTLAEDIAKAFRFRKFHGNWIEAEDFEIGKAKIFWVFGHVLRVDINKTFESAGYPKQFPVFPQKLILEPDSKRKELLKALEKEIKKKEWKYVVNAGDPDREGELLIREVLEYFNVPESKVLRLWFNSQESEALRKALLSMKGASNYRHVYEAGLARQIGDFWFGINGSRMLHHATNNFNLSVGRVQTPVLKLIVDRYNEVKNFKPEDYYVVWIEVEKGGKKARARYVKKTEGLVKEEEARRVREAVQRERYAVVKRVDVKRHKKLPPNLYILSALIKDAGKFGFTAQKTLEVVQRLYEHYKCISYPRTESPYLATADKPDVEKILKRLGYEQFISRIPSRIFNDEDVSEAGHHAIIPINKIPSEASKEEKLIYELILKRFLAQFYPAYEYELMKVFFECGGYDFCAVGKVDLVPGWRVVYEGFDKKFFDKKLDDDEEEKEKEKEKKKKGGSEDFQEEEDVQEGLPIFKEGERVKKTGEGVEKRQTAPPPLYTSSTLVAEMKKRGLGTEATRSTYEMLLLKRGYIFRDKKNRLYPTEKGIALIELLKNEQFVSADYTSQWEEMLDRIMKKKEISLKEKFLAGVKEITRNFIKKMEKMIEEKEVRILSETSNQKNQEKINQEKINQKKMDEAKFNTTKDMAKDNEEKKRKKKRGFKKFKKFKNFRNLKKNKKGDFVQ